MGTRSGECDQFLSRPTAHRLQKWNVGVSMKCVRESVLPNSIGNKVEQLKSTAGRELRVLWTSSCRGIAGFLWLGVQTMEARQTPRIRESQVPHKFSRGICKNLLIVPGESGPPVSCAPVDH
jgi:hypothetical protein